MRFSRASYDKLVGVRPELIAVMTMALSLSPYDFKIIYGVRTQAQQNALYAQGRNPLPIVNDMRRSAGMPNLSAEENNKKVTNITKSRHIGGFAIDYMALPPTGGDSWDLKYYSVITKAVKDAAQLLGVNVECGIDWAMVDAGHVELTKQDFPDKA